MLATCLLCCLPAPDLDLTWEVAVVYSVWELQLEGDAGESFVLLPSLQQGPTSLPVFGGPQLDIGLDLTALARFGVLDGGGKGVVTFDMPQNPALAGLPLRAQAFTFPGSTGLIEDLSGAVQATVAVIGTTHPLPEPVVAPRRFHTATQLADGRVIVIGGESAGGGGSWPLALELYDPQTGEFEKSQATLAAGRAHHTANLLPDGRVLVVGGVRPSGQVLQSAVFYNPTTDSLGGALPLVSPRVGHTTHVLPDGDLLVLGGSTKFALGKVFGMPLTSSSIASAAVERWDASLGSFQSAAALSAGRLFHDSATLANGSVLLVGGLSDLPGGPQTTADARIYDPGLDAWQVIDPLPAPRALLSVVGTETGGALALGGGSIGFGTGNPQFTPSLASWLYKPGGQTDWSSTPNVSGITAGGERLCVPRPKTPPSDTPVAPGTFPPIEPANPDITYFAGGGYESLDLTTGTGVPSDKIFMIKPSFNAWEPSVDYIEARAGESFTHLAGTFRVLRIGASSAPGDTGGEETVLDWPSP